MRTSAGRQQPDDDDFADVVMDEESAVAAQPKPIVQPEATMTRGKKTQQEWEERQEFLSRLLTLDMQQFAMTAVFRRLPEEMPLVLTDMHPAACAELRARDTEHTYEFFSGKPEGHGGHDLCDFSDMWVSMSMGQKGAQWMDKDKYVVPATLQVPQHERCEHGLMLMATLLVAGALGPGATMQHASTLYDMCLVDAALGW